MILGRQLALIGMKEKEKEREHQATVASLLYNLAGISSP